MSNQRARTSWRQKLHAVTGDRDQESHALADTVQGAVASDGSMAVTPDEGKVESAARQAVADAHGDTGVAEEDAQTPDIAEPSTVVDAMAADDDGTRS